MPAGVAGVRPRLRRSSSSAHRIAQMSPAIVLGVRQAGGCGCRVYLYSANLLAHLASYLPACMLQLLAGVAAAMYISQADVVTESCTAYEGMWKV